MIRVSSAGNPWHDKKGKFCSKSEACLIKYNNKFYNCQNKTIKEKENLLKQIKQGNDAYYNNQTNERYQNAVQHSSFKCHSKNEEEFKIEMEEAYSKFVKENAYHINNGGEVLHYIDNETKTINFVCLNADKIVDDTIKNNGASIDISTCTKPFNGYMVAKYPEASKWIDCNVNKKELTKQIKTFCNKNLKKITDKNIYIGTWFDPSTNKISLDLSERIDNLQEAKMLGTKRNEKAIWDVKKSNAIDTGGQGNNL